MATTVWLRRRIRTRWCFVFQAEDGIRAVAVTGVQTCALPISQQGAAVVHAHPQQAEGAEQDRHRVAPDPAQLDRPRLVVAELQHRGGVVIAARGPRPRSEERRGGTEGGPRRPPGAGTNTVVRE